MEGSFGKTWWGKKWLNALENIDYSNRLPRGVSYARKGAVEKIIIKGNHISAKVRGTRVRPYNIDIVMPPFFDPEKSQFIDEIISHPVIISKLLNRELDPAILTLAEKLGLKVFPTQWSDLKMQCSCPDWAVPCKHLAAVIYKVSAEIDNNPFLSFSFHNVDLLKELKQRGIVIQKKNIEIPKISQLYFKKDVKSDPYDPEQAYQKLSFTGLIPIHEALTELLKPYPPFYSLSTTDFRNKYFSHLNRIVKSMQNVAKGKVDLFSFFSDAYEKEESIGYHTENSIILDNDLQARVLVNEKKFSVRKFLQQLSCVKGTRTYDYQPSTASLHSVLHCAIQLIANGAIIPQIVQLPEKDFMIRWLPAMLSKEVKKIVNKLDDMLPPDIFMWQGPKRRRRINANRAENLLSLFLTEIVNLVSIRHNGDLFEDLFFKSIKYSFSEPGEHGLAGGIMTWLQKFYITGGKYKPVLLVEEKKGETFRIIVEIQNTQKNIEESIPLKSILCEEKYNHERFEILQSLTQLSSFIYGLDEFINSGGEENIVMDNNTFTPFLIKIIPAIQLLDISVLLPKSLQNILKPQSSIKLKTKSDTGTGKGYLRLDKLLDFDWQIAIGDKVIDENTFRKLMQKSEGLIKFKTNYFYAEEDDLKKLYKGFTQSGKISAFQMLRAALSGEYHGAKVAFTNEVKQLIEEVTNFGDISLPAGINAVLRPYQKRGFSWIYRNARIGFGSVLADDMGLGKTLQVIAIIMKFKEEGLLKSGKILVVSPTGLITNWEAEVQKFAPGIKTAVYHGSQRNLEHMGNYDMLLTSYGIVRSDAELLSKHKWFAMVIDEAQNIKNQNTKQTKAIKSIKSPNRIALSGTPVENRLSELWSIMDYSNHGLLGSVKEFNDNWGNPIEQLNDYNKAEKLKKITAPFMMRRLKSDKSIISDLPEKIEMDSYASLTNMQIGLYQKTLEKAMNQIEGIEEDKNSLFVRRGLVLQMILSLKQICNHPVQFLKNGLYDASLSGKMELLFDKLDPIIESNEKVLIFTQFTEMGKILHRFINERYNEEPLFYHGGSSFVQRKNMIDRFQNNHADKIFILSLKAAGTGLNLTAANHVIHYDLWWNPAVENQATDRAYRIGQKNNVMVHRFITRNTFEEKINEMIQHKKALADMTVTSGESWIGNMSNKELRSVFGHNM
ncbi:MAG: DEAD/DEAH box helicase [Prolixibacteraceae bacterium]|nr:DEAD/DEAH box helicase [Prolixibacteraceae bacterium]